MLIRTSVSNHGYDSRSADMQAFFLAHGPSFRKKPTSQVPTFPNTEIYNLVLDILAIDDAHRAPNNVRLLRHCFSSA